MQIERGTRLGPYEIVEPVGRGGMGEVYRARDTRLARSVAIKVLPQELMADARLRLRFEREAKAISALNHPHICTLHDVGSENGVDYLVMEYCDGETLADRISRGRLDLDRALQVGAEIADALSRAHRAGIVHRDLKPSNVMLTSSGAKLLDFGLAKERERGGASAETTTLAHPISEEGVVLGTLQYMAPEVIAGREADARSDIFAFGLMLYEMLGGRRAFDADSRAGVMAAILEREPRPLRELRPDLPPALEHLVAKCLAKKPEERWESAHDMAAELRWLREAREPALKRRARWPWIAAAAAVLTILAAIVAVVATRNRSDGGRVARLSIALPPPMAVEVSYGGLPSVALSSDGARIAYVGVADGVRRVYVRELASGETAALPVLPLGSAGPFFSPDGHSIGFSGNGQLFIMEVAGSVAHPILPLFGAGRGADWAADGWIYASPGSSSGLWRVHPNGGDAEQLTTPNAAAGENSHRWPQLLPDGEHLLFTIRTDRITSFDEASIGVLSLRTRTWKTILDGATDARFLPPGTIVFGSGGALYAVPFDPKTFSVTGARRKVIDSVFVNAISGAVQVAIDAEGDLAYTVGTHGDATDLEFYDRTGRLLRTLRVPLVGESLRVSPEEQRIALHASAANDDIWMLDLHTGATTRVTHDPGDEGQPLWMPDGKRIVYFSGPQRTAYMRRIDGAGDREELLAKAIVTDISPDGRSALADCRDSGGRDRACLFDLAVSPRRVQLLSTADSSGEARFSRDGKWIAYESEDSGASQVYVRPVRGDGGQRQVSFDVGYQPRWSHDGKTLFYRTADAIMQAAISFDGNTPLSETPRQVIPLKAGAVTPFDVFGDGIVVGRHVVPPPVSTIDVVLNWKRELLSGK